MTTPSAAVVERSLRAPLRVGIFFTLLVLGIQLGANLLIGGFDPQLHRLLLRGTVPAAVVAPDEQGFPPPEMPPPKNPQDVAHMAFEVVLDDFFPQGLYNTVYVFLISLAAANAPLLGRREQSMITWLVGLGGVAFTLSFLLTGLLTMRMGPIAHDFARSWLFPIPALMLAAAFTWTFFGYLGGLILPRSRI